MRPFSEQPDRQAQHEPHDFIKNGYCLLKSELSTVQINKIESEYQTLSQTAREIILHVKSHSESYADFYRENDAAIIAVPEINSAEQLCRFEFIAGASDYFSDQLIPELAKKIESITKHKVVLFKDKCNLKSPGGGAFPCHQDIPAYIDFGPNIHFTAAIMLDPSNENNGCLEVAENYMEIDEAMGTDMRSQLDTPLGRLPLFDFYHGSKNNGRIKEPIEQQLQWTPVQTEPGDILLFNSYIPHRSAINQSNLMRRALFFTFNLDIQGEHYHTYYKNKREDYANPRFHVATPTEHSDSHYDQENNKGTI